MQTQGTPGTPAGSGECNCVACNEPDSAGNMVQCDHCNSWWHMTCAGVTDSVADRPWTCRRCLPEIVSIQSNSTVRKLRLDLKLKQLEEQRAVEQKFVDEKYKLLNSHLEEPDESASQRGKVSRVEKVEQVKQWLKCSADQTESADTAASSILPSEPRKREERLCDLTRTQHVDDQNQVAKLRLPEQLELLAEQLRQQQTFAGERRRSLDMHPEQHMQQPAPSLWKISPEFNNSRLQMKKQTSMSGNDQVPHVIETLRLLYGRPELLINALLEKVRAVPPPKAEKLESLIDFGMAVQSLCDHLEAADQRAHLSNPSLLIELVDKLPAHVKMEWASHLQRFPEVDLKIFGEFMSGIVRSASRVTLYSGGFSPEEKFKVKKGAVHSHADADVSPGVSANIDKPCLVCNRLNHRLKDCDVFKSRRVEERWRFVQDRGICRICLNSHGRRSCRNSIRCGVGGCQFRHHPLLHSSRPLCAPTTVSPVPSAENHTHSNPSQSLFFRIVPVTLQGQGEAIETFAFLDDGSSLTLIEEGLVQQLGIDGTAQPLCLKWTGNMSRTEHQSKLVQVAISRNGQPKMVLRNARTVKSLSLPNQSLDFKSLSEKYLHFRGLSVPSYQNAVPRILIGLDNLRLTVPLKTKEGFIGEPVAVKTRLGWCIYGGSAVAGISKHSLNFHTCECSNDESLHNMVKDYFSFEDAGTKQESMLVPADEQRALEILERTTKKTGDKFETGLLWRYDFLEFPDSYRMAVKRLECLERRMERDPTLRENLRAQISNYIEKGYAHRATEEELKKADPRRVWYLPLGVVINPKKPNKVRMIWDASAKVNGVSLNTMLLKGPDQLASLPAVLFRFRQFPVAVSADIREMFHQISIRKEDRHAQRFLWRSDPSHKPEVLFMDVATFGSACSPASAQYIKNKNAMEFASKYPRAVEGITKNHYVDDFLDSFESEEEAKEVSCQVRMIHAIGGFDIRNWQSNREAVLNILGSETSQENKNLNLENAEGLERVLGLLWVPSEEAYAAVAYLRTINTEGEPECTLVSAKTKVAPLKPMSIPRLELQAAVLGVRLKRCIIEGHTIPISRCVFWSDSSTVLAWIRADHRRYKQFVAFRIGEILDSTEVNEWRWVPSKLNPADAATKWGKGPQFDMKGSWFQGPDFLKEDEERWPKCHILAPTTEKEMRSLHLHHGIALPIKVIDVGRFSKWNRILRTMSYVYRYLGNLHLKVKGQAPISGHLTQDEMRKAEISLIRMVQWETFPDELVTLTQNSKVPLEERKPIEKSSAIYQESPMIDEFGILRIDGRIKSAESAPYSAKFPIILPKQHELTKLIINHYHHIYRHANSETVFNELRQRYYVPQLRAAVKRVARDCQWCKISKTRPKVPMMAPLPGARLASFVRPFSYVGLDLFGPLLVKVGRSQAKRWVALFTCLTIRAVHVELVHSLTTEACVMSVRRFVSRRGAPIEIHSDNGTNFQGASRLLQDQISKLNEELAATFTNLATRWMFIPPGAPHMGGPWERMVRSVKTAIRIVNSRPLTYLPLDSEEQEALTPNHFLLGSSSGAKQPVVEPINTTAALRSSWNQIQQQVDTFWHRWVREYLPTLTRRTKWFGDVKPIAVGDLVFVVDDVRRNGWIRGRVQHAVTGQDGRVRQAVVQTSKGLMRRPVSKLALLEVSQTSKTEPGTAGTQCYEGEDVGYWAPCPITHKCTTRV
ncbi:uncharacterized protein LOC131688312 [Topomyia yanbarensis]|uniref:uncharacterized protein LOC131688312 n=1 Tax=Topomyia yanbarensis TaxID=2498891 RepID=UPI00273C4A84|nr:uncharacterized protein LOC131688312 [Topomyia yanbarensis]